MAILDYLNSVDEAGKIKFTMEIAHQEKSWEFLDLTTKCVESKLSVDVFAKPNNSFTYLKPSTYYPRENINNVPCGIALRLRRIYDTDDKFESRANEYKQYLIARDYKPSLVDEKFQEVSKITRTEPREKRPKNNQLSKIKFLTTYNTSLPKKMELSGGIFLFSTVMTFLNSYFQQIYLAPSLGVIEISKNY